VKLFQVGTISKSGNHLDLVMMKINLLKSVTLDKLNKIVLTCEIQQQLHLSTSPVLRVF
jgi:hypothetical protein